jgi:hypothetical protein
LTGSFVRLLTIFLTLSVDQLDLFSTEAIDAHFTTHLDRVIAALKSYIPEIFFGLEDDSYELGKSNFKIRLGKRADKWTRDAKLGRKSGGGFRII